MTLSGRHMVISGGGSGVGADIARQAAAAGAKVTVLGRRAGPIEEIAQEIGGHAVSCDVTDAGAVRDALADATEAQGPIFIAVANAGAAPSAPFHKLSSDDFDASLAVNLKGVFHLWQAALPEMRNAGWGRLIAIASSAGLKGYPYVTHYCAAKHGVVGLTRALAHELGTTGVTVNAICPSFIETPLLDRSIEAISAKTGMSTEKAAQSLMAGNPQKRFVQTDEVASAVLWLCSDGAKSVNGHSLALTGGEV